MTSHLERAFEACWSAMLQGETLETCLSRYSDLSHTLRPMLQAAQGAHAHWDSAVPGSAITRSRTRVLSRAAELRRRLAPRRRPSPLPRMAFVGAALFLLFIFGGAGLVAASAETLPGDDLYPIKLAVEQVQLRTALSTSTRLSLASSFEMRRIEEIKRLLLLHRVAPVQFDGRLDQISGDLYTVEGVPVMASPATQLASDLRPGDFVSVAGDTHSAGWVLAASILRAGQQFVGVVDAMGAENWTVSGSSVRLAPDSQIDSGIALGDRVTVQLHSEDGRMVAASIHLLERGSSGPAPVTPGEIPPAAVTSAVPSSTHMPSSEDGAGTPTKAPAPETISFAGMVQSKSQAEWTIDGHTVSVTAQTQIEGSIQTGDTVDVSAERMADGSLRAQKISLVQSNWDGGGDSGESYEFTGRVESISSAQWVIAGRVVLIDSHTDIEGSPEVGDRVQVKVFTKADGSLQAEKIENQDSGSGGEGSSTPSHDD
jgi:hypothetical protein